MQGLKQRYHTRVRTDGGDLCGLVHSTALGKQAFGESAVIGEKITDITVVLEPVNRPPEIRKEVLIPAGDAGMPDHGPARRELRFCKIEQRVVHVEEDSGYSLCRGFWRYHM
jgi:hypothetical protein